MGEHGEREGGDHERRATPISSGQTLNLKDD